MNAVKLSKLEFVGLLTLLFVVVLSTTALKAYQCADGDAAVSYRAVN